MSEETKKRKPNSTATGCIVLLVIMAIFVGMFVACSSNCTGASNEDWDILVAIDNAAKTKYPKGFSAKKITKKVDNGNGNYSLSIRADYTNEYGASYSDQDFHADVTVTDSNVKVRSLSKL